LAEVSYTKGEDIKSVSTQRLTRRLGDVPADRLDRIERVLRLLLGL
jgi:mRNA-degrading endonuclease toxin of MazEF toxin-antitoxin module